MTITVVLNGTSSAGKTSLAEAIRAVSPLAWQISGIDTFLALQPDAMFALPGADAVSDGFTWSAAPVDGVACWDVRLGAQGLRFARAVHQYWAASAAEGINRVIDHVLLNSAMAADLMTRLAPHRPLYVGVRCSADVIDERERQRGDRVIGQGRGIGSHVHNYVPYALEVDTSVLTTEDAAHFVLAVVLAAVLAAVDAAGLTTKAPIHSPMISRGLERVADVAAGLRARSTGRSFQQPAIGPLLQFPNAASRQCDSLAPFSHRLIGTERVVSCRRSALVSAQAPAVRFLSWSRAWRMHCARSCVDSSPIQASKPILNTVTPVSAARPAASFATPLR